MIEKTVGFIGAGQMARALAGGFVKAGLVDAGRLLAHDAAPTATTDFAAAVDSQVRTAAGNRELVESSDVVFLAVKPQHATDVMNEVRGAFRPSQLLVSIAAGITIQRLTSGFGTDRVVRVMPNTPCLVGCGASAFALGPAATPDDSQLVQRLLESVGIAVQLDERLLDAVTGLSGSGPAFVFVLIEALSDGGVRMGLPRAVATQLAAQTVLGAATLAIESGEHPAVLKDRVASPGGTTIAGLQALEDGGLRAAMIAAVQAATARSVELGGISSHG